jgi:L-threonylcarbamoyladenylate synthase
LGNLVQGRSAALVQVPDSGEFSEAVAKGTQEILSGGIVAFPTESFYGLAVDIENEAAIRKLFEVKGRAHGLPILVLIPSRDALERYAARIPDRAWELVRSFWPGGLTLVFEASAGVSKLLTAGGTTIGIRLSNHPVATGLARAVGKAITGTSANESGAPASKSGQEVMQALGDRIDLIIDAGETGGKRGSTVLDLTSSPPRVLREGMVTRTQLSRVLFSEVE